jgi:xanthine dehydrogenase/oxidase
MAALDACDKILARLAPIRARRVAAKEATDLSSLANEAFFTRVDTSAHGFYAVANDRCGRWCECSCVVRVLL